MKRAMRMPRKLRLSELRVDLDSATFEEWRRELPTGEDEEVVVGEGRCVPAPMGRRVAEDVRIFAVLYHLRGPEE
jgi:hypothetical protein